MIEAQLLEWLSKAFGPGVAAGAALYFMARQKRPQTDDPVDRLFVRIDHIDSTLSDVRDRVSKLEGKMSK